MNNEPLLNNVEIVAKSFINSHYSHELSMFDTFWQVYFPQLNKILEDIPLDQLTPSSAENAIASISFAKGNSLDLMTPIIIGTVTETIYSMKSKKLSNQELKDIIASASSRYGAKPGLTACLIKYLPALCSELDNASEQSSEAIVSNPPEPQYQIWIKGNTAIVDSIDKYLKRKDKFMFFLDLRKRTHKTDLPTAGAISSQAVNLLKYLTSRLGVIIPSEDIFKDVFDNEMSEFTDIDKNNIEQQITKLQKYSGNKFRSYLFGDHTKGYGLKNSFADKYFIFDRLR